MASAAAVSCVVVALLLVSIPGAHPTTAPAVESSCGADLIRLLPCLPFADGDAPAPSDTCCANVGSMVHDEPLCLCQALSQSSSGGFPVPVNVSRALQLPHLCRLDLPPAASACAGILPGGAAPPVNVPSSNASSTAPSTQSPVTRTPSPLPTPPPPPSTSRQMPEYSTGVKLIAGCAHVALGFLALVSALTF